MGKKKVRRKGRKAVGVGAAGQGLWHSDEAQMAELVDALVSGASVERRAGSSPVLGTTWFR